jgi:hypothetical protein
LTYEKLERIPQHFSAITAKEEVKRLFKIVSRYGNVKPYAVKLGGFIRKRKNNGIKINVQVEKQKLQYR